MLLRRSPLFHSIVVSHPRPLSLVPTIPTFVYHICREPDRHYPLYATKMLGNMTNPSARVLSATASKRARSQDSQRSLNSSPAIEAPRTEDAPDNTRIPAVLRQTKAGMPLCMSKLRAMRPACTKGQQKCTPNLKSWNGNSNFALLKAVVIQIRNGCRR